MELGEKLAHSDDSSSVWHRLVSRVYTPAAAAAAAAAATTVNLHVGCTGISVLINRIYFSDV